MIKKYHVTIFYDNIHMELCVNAISEEDAKRLAMQSFYKSMMPKVTEIVATWWDE